MDTATVKELVTRHFGKPKRSLTLGSAREAGEGMYFYTLENETEIAGICNILGTQFSDHSVTLPTLKQTFSKKEMECGQLPQCAYFRESSDGFWELSFYEITGVTYHSIYKMRTVATLQLGKNPFVRLYSSSLTFYGFWEKSWFRHSRTPQNDREGFSYWVNKALKNSERFRMFAVDFFFAKAQSEHLPILKDVARTIQNCGCFLPPISYGKLLAYRTPADLMRSFPAEEPALPINFNRVDLNAGYVMHMLAHAVDRRDWPKLSKLDVQTISEAVSLPLFYDVFQAEEFLRSYYKKEFERLGLDRDFAEDFMRLYQEAGEKFRIGCSREAYRRIHDELSENARKKTTEAEFRQPLLAVPSVFDGLETALKRAGRDEFERIGTTERLFKEGECQHNCVFSRRTLVRKDRVSIYRWNHKNTGYTVQFIRNQNGRYAATEVKARFNRPITEEHRKDLEEQLAGISTVNNIL